MLIKAILLGVFFGFALYKVGAHLPSRVSGMLRLQDFFLMKAILFAIGLASTLMALAHFVGLFDISHLSVKPVHLGVVVGGLIFGLGFSLGGTCPGTCIAAIGTGISRKKGLMAILGGLIGALLFNLSYGYFAEGGLFEKLDLGKLTLFKLSEKFPAVLNIGFPGLLLMGLALMGVAFALPENR
ncbi:MAG: YeeE/YedE thiosulfate transporter family protein [Eubacteriales bacterium]|nr:YeeE/YedE thiosulfate transporter family protein [Eubacteriales bacterium]